MLSTEKFVFDFNNRYGKIGGICGRISPYTEQDNLQREPIQEDITTNSSELLQIVKELKSEMESIKKKNERILRAQEELNRISIERFHE